MEDRPMLRLLLISCVHLILILPEALATNHIVRISEVMTGFNGDTSIQFIEMEAFGNGQKAWGPNGGPAGRAMLVFLDENNVETGRFVFPNNAPSGQNTVLIGTQAFATLSGLTLDFTLTPGLSIPLNGKVCFRSNPASSGAFGVNLCLAYGSFSGATEESSGIVAPAIPSTGAPLSLSRTVDGSFGSQNNTHFAIRAPTPTNTQNATFNFQVPGPEISVTPTALAFDPVNISIPVIVRKNVSITNLGISNALQITALQLAGADASQFRIASDTGETSIAPGSTRTVGIEFAPATIGLKAAVLRIESSDSDEATVDVALSGESFDDDPCAVPDPSESIVKDDCADARLACPGIVYSGSTTGFNTDGVAACATSGADGWFRYRPATSGPATIDLLDSDFDTVLSVHSECPGVVANQIACDDDGSNDPDGRQSKLTFTAQAGIEIFIRIAGFAGDNGTFNMEITGPACFDFDRNSNDVNDACEVDFGDAPNLGYPTTLADDGARHSAVTNLFLGARVDLEADGVPSPLASGDNLDGPQSDEDGVTFTSPLIQGAAANVEIVASQAGTLNAWIDYNGDGDWSDTFEQIFSDTNLAQGTNSLTVTPPANAIVGTVFARFRVNSAGGLGVSGAALDGEVEDYALEILPPVPVAGDLGVRINEVMAGMNGNSRIQFVELEVADAAQKGWGPQGAESAGRAMLAFFDGAGRKSGRFVFPSDAPGGGPTVLVATPAFAALPGAPTPDFVMPPEVMAINGRVTFTHNPDNTHFNVSASVSYGGSGFLGDTAGGGAPNTAKLPIMDAVSLTRTGTIAFGTSNNTLYALQTPTPVNTAGGTFVPTPLPVIDQGRTLFNKEGFQGNGRTCLTCHLPGDQFGLAPNTVAALPADDLLFITEFGLNVLTLSGRSQPSDLRGSISGTTGSATVLTGSDDTFLVYGGSNLTGTISDANGNQGTFLAFQAGLTGPTPSNGSPRGLEDPVKMRGGRALILENIDGFDELEVFRASPHLLNIVDTAPYGLSGEFADLRVFSDGAVQQHFSRTLNRVSGKDFRHPEPRELDAMEAFMNTVLHPGDEDFNLDRFATTQAQKRGRELFFSDQGRCSKCHSGPALAHSDGSLPGSINGINENFNTGVSNLPVNTPSEDGLPTEPAGQANGLSPREFNTPPLFGIRLTPPFFHDGSVATLREAVEFYDTFEFISSPAGADVGSIPAANDPQGVSDLVAFLNSLVEIPVDFPSGINFGSQGCFGPSETSQAVVTNSGAIPLTITNVNLAGPDQTAFSIAADTGEGVLAPGQQRIFDLVFDPAGSDAPKEATLEITASDGGTLGEFSFGIALEGEACSNFNQWQIDNFALADLQNQSLEATVWGPDANPDNDILPNIFEFLHGLDPAVPNFDPQIVLGKTTSGADTFATYTFVKRRDLEGTTLTVEVAANRNGPFSPVPIVESELDPVDADFVMATATDPQPTTTNQPRFGKVVIVPTSAP